MRRRSLCVVAAVLALSAFANTQSGRDAAAVTIACRALEVHTDPELKTAVIVFHQRDQAQASELAVLLRDHAGQLVEIQGDDGGWRSARLERLKSAFGRGMLMLAAPSPVAERSQFLMRVPGGATPPSP
ncbi:MAG TPA: hypothetical protein VMD98_02320 [Bryocella sp.]|nr:hypothetical protein [Bryocella sp.]